MIVDSHCHAWTTWPYDTGVPDPATRGTVDQLLFEMDQHDVDRSVVICARIDHNPLNNEYIADAARRLPDRITAFPDIDSGWSPEYHTPGAADRLRAAVERWGSAGFTHYVRTPNDGWLVSDEGMAFFAAAAEADQIASIACDAEWLADVRRVATAFPTLPILLHHQGMARAVDGAEGPGLTQVLGCAQVPNILVKASGFYYGSRAWAEYPYPDQIATFARIAEAFGPRRLTWGSNFPSTQGENGQEACTYRQTIDVVRVHCAAILAEDGIPWVMGETMATLLRTRRPLDG
jgi:L-fuconolactonase